MDCHSSTSRLPLQLLRLVSPSHPVGAFSYSRGLEWAVHAGTVRDEPTAQNWILGLLEHCYACLDGAVFWRMVHSLREGHSERFLDADRWLQAARESRELELEDRRMGEALLHLLVDLEIPQARSLSGQCSTFPGAFAIAAVHWQVDPHDALLGLMWSVVEGQVSAAIRLVPLGHTAGQRILIAGAPVIERAAQKAATLLDDEVGNVAPAMAMASAWHESQYSRLFRS